MRLSGGGDGSVHCGKWRQAWGRNKLLFYFSTWLLSFTALPSGHDENNSLRFVIATNPDATPREMPVVEAAFQVSLSPEKIQRLQTVSVIIAATDEGCFSIRGDRAYVLTMPIDILHVRNIKGKKSFSEFQENTVVIGMVPKLCVILHSGIDQVLNYVCIFMH